MTSPYGVQVWSDEFDGVELDTLKWKATTAQMFSGYGQETWDPAHATVANSVLRLQATDDLHSADVRSVPSFDLPLYVEFRVKLPSNHPGFWPAGWTLGVVANSAQEVDIFECDSSQPKVIGENLHWGVQGAAPFKNGSYASLDTDFTQDFHVYGALINSERVEFYVDDVLRLTRLASDTGQVFTDPMQIRLSLSIFGPKQPNHLAPDSTTVWPADLLVDWVRIYKVATTPPPPPTDTTSPIVSILSPASGSIARKSKVPVMVMATDNVTVARVELYVNNVLLQTDTVAPYSFSFTTSGKPRATYLIEAIAYDASGNTAQASVTVQAGS